MINSTKKLPPKAIRLDDLAFERPDLLLGIEYTGAEQSKSRFVVSKSKFKRDSIVIDAVVHAQPGISDESALKLDYLHKRQRALRESQVIIKAMIGKETRQSWTAQLKENLEYWIEILGRSSVCVSQEGNAIEVLRMIRDTIDCGGWVKYADDEVCIELSEFVGKIGSASQVLPPDLESLRKICEKYGLDCCSALSEWIIDLVE